jgi:SOS-response transcriptional repressor LexA
MPFDPAMIERQRARGRMQRQLALDFIADYIAEHGWAPTVREIAAALETDVSTAHGHIRILAEDGRIVKGTGPRMIRVNAGGSIRVS